MNLQSSKDILASLVSFDTVSRNSNLDLISWVEGYLDKLGVKHQRIYDETGKKSNLWATLGPKDVPGYILSGHTDVVPVDDQNWTDSPFKLTERDGKLYGRGSTDMKGYVACCLAAVPDMLKANLKKPLHLAFSYDEEIGCVGVRPMLAEISRGRLKPLGCFVGEPTEMQVTIGHKGKHGVRATFHGLAAHSSIAPSGVNAVEFAADLIGEIRRRAQQLTTGGAHDALYDVAHTTLLTSIVHGGTALNIVPERCVVEFECRGLGVTESKEVTDAIVAWARAEIEPVMKAADRSCGIHFEEILDYPALDVPSGHALVTLAKKFAGRNSHAKVSFGTEAGLFVSMADIPAIVVGPGSIAQAHKPDEYVEMSELLACADFVERLIGHCAAGGALAP